MTFAAARTALRRPTAGLRRAAMAGILLVAGAVSVAGPAAGLVEHLAPESARVAYASDRTPKNGVRSATSLERKTLEQVCGSDLDGFIIDGMPMCTHGGDATPPGLDTARSVAPVRAGRAAQTVTCIGDGVSGPRIEALYVYDVAKGDRYAQFRDSFQTWIADMDDMFDESAQLTGGRRVLRMVTDANCQPVVTSVGITASEIATFGGSIAAVKAKGFTDPNRNYVLFADTDVYCGIGTVRDDSSKTAGNLNNRGGSFARADHGCWNGFVIAHEVMHNLGAVQMNAPHSSGAWHCTDENDVMCYADGGSGRPSLDYACTSGVWAIGDYFDCNHDDYFNTAPTAGSYLATNWNTADSAFLHDPGDDGPNEGGLRGSLQVDGTAKRGKSVVVRAGGFRAGESIEIALDGAPLASMTANAAGAASGQVTIPAKAKVGVHVLEATGDAGSSASADVSVSGGKSGKKGR